MTTKEKLAKIRLLAAEIKELAKDPTDLATVFPFDPDYVPGWTDYKPYRYDYSTEAATLVTELETESQILVEAAQYLRDTIAYAWLPSAFQC